SMGYSFQVVGPTTGINIPLLVYAGGNLNQVSGGDWAGSGATAELTVSSPLTTLLDAQACINFLCGFNPPPPSFSLTATPITVKSGAINDVVLSLDLFATANVGGITPSQVKIDGSVDPLIIIDPSFSLASEYQLQFSPGIINSPSAVPSPIAGAGLP